MISSWNKKPALQVKRMALKDRQQTIAVADMVKKEAADTLDKVLFELCGQMKNAFARSDA